MDMIDTSAYRVALLDSSHMKRVAAIEAACFSSGWSVSQYETACMEKWFFSYGIFFSEQLFGYIAMSILDEELEVLNVAILPEFRSKGCACKLMNFAFKDSHSRIKWNTAILEVRENNLHAIALYKKLGFTISGKRNKYYEDGTNALCMTLNAVWQDKCWS